MAHTLKKSLAASLAGSLFCFSLSTASGGTPALAQGSGWFGFQWPGQSPGQQEYFKLVSAAAHAPMPKIVGEGSGSLAALDSRRKELGTCALKHTQVSVHISGYIASVDVKQSFHNSYSSKIEAVYKFPLSDTAAVDDMTMKVGDRVIHGTIKKREEAREIYEQAKDEGYVASLLDQERPNVFTQSVANIEPGKDIDVTVHYVDLLPFQDGAYSFVFPTVVGPRYNPGTTASGPAAASSGPGISSASVNPPVVAERTRSGHDLSISVDIDEGMPVPSLSCPLHAVSIHALSPSSAHIELANQATIPNKDFVLSFNVAGDRLKSGYLTHRAGKSGFLTLMLVPPKRVTAESVAPKEMIFLIDRSGSQSGPPLDKAKETMQYILQHMNPNDTFQVMSFSNDTESLFDKPQRASRSMIAKASKYIELLTADGGTEMGPAIKKVCSIPEDSHRLRIVTFMTDGYVTNDEEILGLVRSCRGTSRWFSFGTGNSVNRFQIDGIAKEGGGEADYILLDRPGQEVAEHFYQEIASPVLTDVKVDFEGVKVEDVFPRQICDVWADRPLYIKARYTGGGKGIAHLRGFAGGKPYVQDLALTLPDAEPSHPEIAQIWARAAVDDLMSLDWFGAQSANFDKKLKEQIVDLALRFHIMTQFTSFVAVDSAMKTKGEKPLTVEVPVDMPEGVSLEGLFKEGDDAIANRSRQQMIAADADANPGTAWNIRKNYFLRYPAAAQFGPSTAGGSSVAGNAGGAGAPVPHPSPVAKPSAVQKQAMTTFGLPVSNTQFQVIQRYNSGTAASTPVSNLAVPAPKPITASGGGYGYASPAASGPYKNLSGNNTGSQTRQLIPPPPAVSLSTQVATNPIAPPYADPNRANANPYLNPYAMPNQGAAAIVVGASMQGATNGTIGPQGVDAGTVAGVDEKDGQRASNPADQGAVLWLAGIFFSIALILCSLSLIVRPLRKRHGARKNGAIENKSEGATSVHRRSVLK